MTPEQKLVARIARMENQPTLDEWADICAEARELTVKNVVTMIDKESVTRGSAPSDFASLTETQMAVWQKEIINNMSKFSMNKIIGPVHSNNGI